MFFRDLNRVFLYLGMISRINKSHILEWVDQNKAIILTGPRQVGKTTLTREMVSNLENREVLWITGDDPTIRAEFTNIGVERLRQILAGHQVLVVDEAQRIPDVGLMLKMVTDHFPEIQLFVTGSSTLDLATQTKENLTGRKIDFHLYPISYQEMVEHHGTLKERSLLEQRIVMGYYPEIVNRSIEQGKTILRELADGLMYKDLLTLDQINKPSFLVKLLQALALQIGNEVKYSEIAQLIGSHPETVEKYIDLLEKSFVVFRLSSLNRNVRNEIKKGKKIYFYDTGIRNAIIRNYSPVNLRNDIGALWENFLIAERVKMNAYLNRDVATYFWRTNQQQEIDFIEESNGQVSAFEFKWNPRKAGRFSKTFTNAYPVKETQTITPDGFESFVGL